MLGSRKGGFFGTCFVHTQRAESPKDTTSSCVLYTSKHEHVPEKLGVHVLGLVKSNYVYSLRKCLCASSTYKIYTAMASHP